MIIVRYQQLAFSSLASAKLCSWLNWCILIAYLFFFYSAFLAWEEWIECCMGPLDFVLEIKGNIQKEKLPLPQPISLTYRLLKWILKDQHASFGESILIVYPIHQPSHVSLQIRHTKESIFISSQMYSWSKYMPKGIYYCNE